MNSVEKTQPSIGSKVRQERNKLRLNVRELADRAGVSTGVVSNLENDKPVSHKSLRQVLEAVGLVLDVKPAA